MAVEEIPRTIISKIPRKHLDPKKYRPDDLTKFNCVEQKDNLFKGYVIYVFLEEEDDDRYHKKYEVMRKIHKHGGRLGDSAEFGDANLVICQWDEDDYDADYNDESCGIDKIKEKGKVDIVRSQWIYDCIAAGKRLPLREKYFYHATEERKRHPNYTLPSDDEDEGEDASTIEDKANIEAVNSKTPLRVQRGKSLPDHQSMARENDGAQNSDHNIYLRSKKRLAETGTASQASKRRRNSRSISSPVTDLFAQMEVVETNSSAHEAELKELRQLLEDKDEELGKVVLQRDEAKERAGNQGQQILQLRKELKESKQKADNVQIEAKKRLDDAKKEMVEKYKKLCQDTVLRSEHQAEVLKLQKEKNAAIIERNNAVKTESKKDGLLDECAELRREKEEADKQVAAALSERDEAVHVAEFNSERRREDFRRLTEAEGKVRDQEEEMARLRYRLERGA